MTILPIFVYKIIMKIMRKIYKKKKIIIIIIMRKYMNIKDDNKKAYLI